MMKLLLIEDDREIAAALRHVLSSDYTLTLAPTGAQGLSEAAKQKFDGIILDLHLPDTTGLDVCRQIRNEGLDTPVLILTGETKVLDKIRLLDAGADDYLTKPFSLGELKARLRALQRRSRKSTASGGAWVVGDLALDRNTHRVERAGKEISLRRKEFALLECLMLHSGMVVSRTVLGNHAWPGPDKPWTNTIDVHIKHLRDKIDRPFPRPMIRTVHGLGYKLESVKAAEKTVVE